jgi:peptide/nickel transport system permease protein
MLIRKGFVNILKSEFLSRVLGRLIRSIAVAFWVMVIAFTLMRLAPGDPALARLGPGAEPEAIALLQKQLRLDVNPLQQFWGYFVELLQGSLGDSLQTSTPVLALIGQTLPVTLYLILLSTFFALLLSIPIGTAIAWSGRSPLVYGFRTITAMLLAIPNFFLALVGMLFFSVKHNWAPVFGYNTSFPENLRYLWLPVLVNTIIMTSVISRVVFSSIVETKREEFVETGIIRGVGKSRFFWFYILKPSLAPTVVLLSYMMGTMLGATVILETIFSLPGIGRELVTAVLVRDYPVVQGIVLVFGAITVFLSFMGDLVAYYLDRRVKI